MTPSITTAKRSRRPATRSTSSAFFELDTTATGVPAAASRSSSASEPGYGAMPSLAQHALEEGVLAIADAADRVGLERIRRMTPRHLDVAAAQQARDAVVALLAVEVLEVVALGVRRRDVPRGEELLEHRLPRVHVHLGRRRQHAVQIEEHGVVGGQIGKGVRGHVTSSEVRIGG